LPKQLVEVGDTGKVSAGSRQTSHKPGLNWVAAGCEDDRNGRGRIFRHECLIGAAARRENIDLAADETGGQCG